MCDGEDNMMVMGDAKNIKYWWHGDIEKKKGHWRDDERH
jgi:hypothetical protein